MPASRSRKPNPSQVDAFVIEDDEDTRREVSAALLDLNLSVRGFGNAGEALAAVAEDAPKIIFLDIALDQSDAVDVIKGLGKRRYRGKVQLFSGHPRLLDAIQRIALRYHLTVRPPMSKPLGREAIAGIVAAAGVGSRQAPTPAN